VAAKKSPTSFHHKQAVNHLGVSARPRNAFGQLRKTEQSSSGSPPEVKVSRDVWRPKHPLMPSSARSIVP